MILSAPAEDCLLLIHRLEERGETSSTSGLARALGVTDSTVTAMVQKLVKLRLVLHKPRKEIALSKQGIALAARLIRRHRLIETYLHEQLDYSWDEVHAEAEQLEHAVSDRFVAAIDRKLGYPKFDPHGDPIPDTMGVAIERDLLPLPRCKPGTAYTLARVVDTRDSVLQYLTSIGLNIGAATKLVRIPDHDAIIVVSVAGRDLTLSTDLASRLFMDRARPTRRA